MPYGILAAGLVLSYWLIFMIFVFILVYLGQLRFLNIKLFLNPYSLNANQLLASFSCSLPYNIYGTDSRLFIFHCCSNNLWAYLTTFNYIYIYFPDGKQLLSPMDACNIKSSTMALLSLPPTLPSNSSHLTHHRSTKLLKSNNK